MDTQGSVWCWNDQGHTPMVFMGSTVDIHTAGVGVCVWSGLYTTNREKQGPQGCNLSCPYLSERVKQGPTLSSSSHQVRTPLRSKGSLGCSCLPCRHTGLGKVNLLLLSCLSFELWEGAELSATVSMSPCTRCYEEASTQSSWHLDRQDEEEEQCRDLPIELACGRLALGASGQCPLDQILYSTP